MNLSLSVSFLVYLFLFLSVSACLVLLSHSVDFSLSLALFHSFPFLLSFCLCSFLCHPAYLPLCLSVFLTHSHTFFFSFFVLSSRWHFSCNSLLVPLFHSVTHFITSLPVSCSVFFCLLSFFLFSVLHFSFSFVWRFFVCLSFALTFFFCWCICFSVSLSDVLSYHISFSVVPAVALTVTLTRGRFCSTLLCSFRRSPQSQVSPSCVVPVTCDGVWMGRREQTKCWAHVCVCLTVWCVVCRVVC